LGHRPARGLRAARRGGPPGRRLAALAALVTFAATAAYAIGAIEPGAIAIPSFSDAARGAGLPAGWRPVTIPAHRAAKLSLVDDNGATVLRVRSENAFGSAAHSLSVDPKDAPMLSWRWKVDRVVAGARMEAKGTEDFAARVYVSFDYPLEELPLRTRAQLALARVFYGDVPAAAICYVWDNSHPIGTAQWSVHFDHVRVVVLQSGNSRAGQWVEERRDVDADFRAAFGKRWARPTPRIVAIVAGNDTDQTGESVTAWFGDFHLGARP
jgi:hypothetical protein